MFKRTKRKLLEEAERQTLDYFKNFKSPYSEEEQKQIIHDIREGYQPKKNNKGQEREQRPKPPKGGNIAQRR